MTIEPSLKINNKVGIPAVALKIGNLKSGTTEQRRSAASD
jgi:hypothetical protein